MDSVYLMTMISIFLTMAIVSICQELLREETTMYLSTEVVCQLLDLSTIRSTWFPFKMF